MGNNSITILITMICYMAIVIGIGLFFAKRANKSSENFFIGGRGLGPWIAAMSARGFRHERLASDGASRRCLLVRHCRRRMDGNRTGRGNLRQLASCSKTPAKLLHRGRRRHHRA